MKEERVAERIIAKWLKKGNMPRAMRDLLPKAGLTAEERNNVALIVHHIVRFKKLYDYALENEGLDKEPRNYILLFKKPKTLERYSRDASKKGLMHIYYSSSREVANILKLYPQFAEKINREPRTHLAVNLSRIERDSAIMQLKDEGFEARYCTPETCLEVEPHARYSQLVNNGLAIVQDSSSQHVAKIISSLGNEILDYCAGSGGKSFTIKFFNPRARVYVNDTNQRKIESLFERAKILGLEYERMDEGKNYDVVLVDAPCSGLGSAARNPEVKYQENLDHYPKMQMEIMNEAKKFVKENGFLVYVVCTFNPDETYLLVEKFLRENGDFTEYPISAGKIYRRGAIGGYITSGDIMYIALLRR